MAFRYIHKSWKFFWEVVFAILVFVLILVGGVFIILQLDATEDIIAQKIETVFADQFRGELIIGELDGALPFNAIFNNVRLVTDIDSTRSDTVATVERLEVGINLRMLLQNKLVINEFSLKEPNVRFLSEGEGSYSILQAIQSETKQDTAGGGGFIKDIEIIAPQLSVMDGMLYIETFYDDTTGVNLPESLTVRSFEAQIFLELTTDRRFLDIEELSAIVQSFKTKEVDLSGQIYNNNKVLEFNAFNLSIGKSQLNLNGVIKGINLYAGSLVEQFKKAAYDINIGSNQLVLAEFNRLITDIPNVKEPLEFELKIMGPLNTLELQTFKFGIDRSYFSIEGKVDDLINQKEVNYTFSIDTLEVYRNDINRLTGQADVPLFEVLNNLNLRGYAQGSSDTLSLNIEGNSPLGRFSFMGRTQLIEPYDFIGRLSGQSVDISPFVSGIDTTHLNFAAGIKGKNVALTVGRLYFKGDIYNSLFTHIPIDTLQLTATLDEGVLNASYFYSQEKERIEGKVTANFNPRQTALRLKGQTKRLNLATLLVSAPVDSSSINTSYNVELQGLKPDNISGNMRFQVEPSMISGDSVKAHQIEIKLSTETKGVRTLAVNSSLFDLQIIGDIKPTAITDLTGYWSNYFDRHITKEIFLDSVKVAQPDQFSSLQPVQLKGKVDFKQLDIVKNYLPSFPSITTDGMLQFKVAATTDSLQFSAHVQSDTLVVAQTNLENADVRLQGRFRHSKMLKQYSNLELRANARRLKTDIFDLDSLRMHFRFHQDSLLLAQHIEQFSDTASYRLKVRGALTDTTVTAAIEDFFLGNYHYAWTVSQTPEVTYTHARKFMFDSFRFQNRESYLALKGVLSPEPDDSLEVMLRDVNLDRISNLMREELKFGGNLNATLKVQSIKNPAVQGKVTVDQLTVKEHFLGQLSLESNYKPQKKRLGVKLIVDTYSINFEDFSALTIGDKNVIVQGFYNPDASAIKSDSLFHFEANFNALNPWVLSFLLDDIFQKVDGIVTGGGTITKVDDTVDYHADFQLHDLFVKPVFVNTEWYLNGEVRLERKKGVIINNVNIKDQNDGTGTITGKVVLNNDGPEEYIDLELRLDKLKFLSNNYETDIPFYGSVAGTGTVKLVGPTDDLRLSSIEDIVVTQNSKFGIPLVTKTQVTEADEFIEFVESFENPKQALRGSGSSSNDSTKVGPLNEAVENLTFTDRVNIDLQFRAPQPINVTLLFAPTTGEKMTARGTGNLRIIMEGGDVQLFGRFNINGGIYNFAINQLFQRKIDIRPGGTIVWSGSPEKARLNNVEAVYHARPEVASLIPGYEEDSFSRSIPVDLVIEITGTLNSIQQNFYFELPGYVTSIPRLQFSINRINSNEELKLLEAASIIASGEFLKVAPGKSGAAAFGQQLTRSSTFINPIISNQIVSPFLSDQINALLNSEVAEVDVDFELDAYNEIDLGIALRLYNDRLILQRQGGLTGGPGQDTFVEQLGNLSIVYRITPHLSVRAFHRQVPTLGVFSNTGATDFQPSVEGVGLEAEISFNTWQELWSDFVHLLGITSGDNVKTQNSQTSETQENTQGSNQSGINRLNQQ